MKNPDQHLNPTVFRTFVVGWVGLFIIISVAWYWFSVTPVPVSPPMMRFTESSYSSNNALCPGDTLHYSIGLRVEEPGVYVIDVSVFRITPPATVLFSDARRFVASEPLSYSLQREWTIPENYIDPVTGKASKWIPGKYERRHGLSTSSRATEPSYAVIPFTIKEGCE